jgi:anaerobic carbon-monoxide dehydrogenase catalytic subunit
MLIRADELGIGTAFSRADDMAPCNIGGAGMCCKMCGMGPCRLTKDGQTGVCGATIDTIQARNLIRAIAAGAAPTPTTAAIWPSPSKRSPTARRKAT